MQVGIILLQYAEGCLIVSDGFEEDGYFIASNMRTKWSHEVILSTLRRRLNYLPATVDS